MGLSLFHPLSLSLSLSVSVSLSLEWPASVPLAPYMMETCLFLRPADPGMAFYIFSEGPQSWNLPTDRCVKNVKRGLKVSQGC